MPYYPPSSGGVSPVAVESVQGKTGTVLLELSDFDAEVPNNSGTNLQDILTNIAMRDPASAYDIWLSLGNSGTEQDFIEYLRGPRGPEGPTGNKGADGPRGIQGDEGPEGPQGRDGTSITIEEYLPNLAALTALEATLTEADRGKSYITMEFGNLHFWTGTSFTDVGKVVGPQGIPGRDGLRGDEGARGPQGIPGERGLQGITGKDGANATPLPSGGTIGQVLTKTGTSDSAYIWQNASLPTHREVGSIISTSSSTSGAGSSAEITIGSGIGVGLLRRASAGNPIIPRVRAASDIGPPEVLINYSRGSINTSIHTTLTRNGVGGDWDPDLNSASRHFTNTLRITITSSAEIWECGFSLEANNVAYVWGQRIK